MSLKGKVIAISGASSGIGLEASRECLAQGAKISICSRNPDNLAKGLAELTATFPKENILSTVVDVADSTAVASWIEITVAHFGRLDGAVNNAGIGPEGGVVTPLMTMSNEAWDTMIRTNLSGVFYAMRAEINAMLKNKADANGSTGSIVNISSLGGTRGFPGASNYCATKWGVIGLAKTVAREMGTYGIRANAVCPGIIDTPMVEGTVGDLSEGLRSVAETSSLGRMGAAAECAGIIAFLLSDKASYVTGSFHMVDGGASA
ncbi:hypothetical protein OIDMADRAFT_118017 [Oidiodendron maius Zn]|uniref:Uncharacterized protein n=1 Tax=Oidiodendron maius (strain Zn) TaxID=913774 RepID=A0A0C3DN23_OIDMZ|nr:hypothetical protein OIDMADRAFT_118017 [Oidiodendron maius Zn]